VDVQWAEAQSPKVASQQDAMLQQSGFADLQYLVVDSIYASGMLSTNAELAFKGPRQGVASWLAAPAPIGGLDFVSADATIAAGAVVKNLSDAFDDIENLAGSANSTSKMDFAQLEKEFKINLKEDLLKKVGGQFVVALDGPIAPAPAWKVIFQVSDASGLEKTFQQALAAINAEAQNGEEKKIIQEEHSKSGVTTYTLRMVNGQKHGQKTEEIGYAFADGYLIVAANPAMVEEAVEIHRSGRSLEKSGALRALMSQDQPNGVSALVYQNLLPALGPLVQQQAPDMANLVQLLAGHSKPSLATASAGESTIRLTAVGHGLDANMSLLVAALVIPNLMKSRTEANGAGAVATLRTLNTAQVMYQTTYATFAPNLSALGPGPDATCVPNESHACLIDSTVACSSTAGCVKNGFRFSFTVNCEKDVCDDYAIVAIPADTSSEGKSYCSAADAVIRSQAGHPMSPVSASDCRSWEPL